MANSTDPLKPLRRPVWRQKLDGLVGTFVTGLLFLLPFIITLMILDWVIRQIAGLFGEETILGTALFGSSALIFGEGALGVWIILFLLVGAIWAVGRAFQNRAKASAQARIDAWIERIPVFGGVYRTVSRITRMIGTRDEHELAAMRPISCRFGSEQAGADVLALLASSKPLFIGGEPRMLVYMPSAPLPMTGALVLVPPENIIEVEGLKVEDLLKYYVSLGTVLPPDLEARTDPALARMLAQERAKRKSEENPS